MGEEAKIITQIAPALAYLVGAIMVIIFVKRYLFAGMVSNEQHYAQIEREREIIKNAEGISNALREIVKSLELLTAQIKDEIGQNTERLRSLEMAMSDYLESFHELNHNFELHRRGLTDTEQLKVERQA